jgi:two-component system, NarL family, response regulator NreC
MAKIKVLLADDHTIFREGLCMLLSQEKDLEIVGEANDGEEAVRLTQERQPDVLVMDIGMPGLNGVEATRRIRESFPEARVIGLSVHKDKQFIKGMLAAGAKGYLPKNCGGVELVRAIRDVMNGHVYLNAAISAILVDDYVSKLQSSEQASLTTLTEREREVTRLLALGQHNKQIASSLGVSDKTIENHRQHIMEKLGAHSTADLARFAMREKLISPED